MVQGIRKLVLQKNLFGDLFGQIGAGRSEGQMSCLFILDDCNAPLLTFHNLIPVTTRLEATESERVRHTQHTRGAQLGAFGLRGQFG